MDINAIAEMICEDISINNGVLFEAMELKMGGDYYTHYKDQIAKKYDEYAAAGKTPEQAIGQIQKDFQSSPGFADLDRQKIGDMAKALKDVKVEKAPQQAPQPDAGGIKTKFNELLTSMTPGPEGVKKVKIAGRVVKVERLPDAEQTGRAADDATDRESSANMRAAREGQAMAQFQKAKPQFEAKFKEYLKAGYDPEAAHKRLRARTIDHPESPTGKWYAKLSNAEKGAIGTEIARIAIQPGAGEGSPGAQRLQAYAQSPQAGEMAPEPGESGEAEQEMPMTPAQAGRQRSRRKPQEQPATPDEKAAMKASGMTLDQVRAVKKARGGKIGREVSEDIYYDIGAIAEGICGIYEDNGMILEETSYERGKRQRAKKKAAAPPGQEDRFAGFDPSKKQSITPEAEADAKRIRDQQAGAPAAPAGQENVLTKKIKEVAVGDSFTIRFASNNMTAKLTVLESTMAEEFDYLEEIDGDIMVLLVA